MAKLAQISKNLLAGTAAMSRCDVSRVLTDKVTDILGGGGEVNVIVSSSESRSSRAASSTSSDVFLKCTWF